MTYTIQHGNIAAVQYVDTPEGKRVTCVYLSDGKPVESTDRDARDFAALPMEVRAAVNRQFGQVFSLPLESRDVWVKAQVPFTVAHTCHRDNQDRCHTCGKPMQEAA